MTAIRTTSFRTVGPVMLALALLLTGCGKEKENPNLASVRIEQLTFKPVPTDEEIEKTGVRAQVLLDSILAGADLETMARQYSTHSSASRGGVITLTTGWMPAGFDESVDTLPDGAISGLIRTPTAYYIVRRDSSEYLSVRSSHILIRVDTTRAWVARDKAIKEAEDKAWEMYNRIQAGESFHDLAREFSEDPGSAQNGGDLGWTKRNSLVRDYENVAFGQPEGAVSRPVKSSYGYHVIRTVKKRDLNLFLRLIEIKATVKDADLARARKVADHARGLAMRGRPLEQIQEELQGGPDAELSYSKPYEVRKRMLIPQIAQIVDKLGRGDVSEVLGSNSGYYFIRLVDK